MTREQIGALLEIIGSRERTFTEAHEAEKAILAAFDALTAEHEASARDAERLDALTDMLHSGRCGNGLAFMPITRWRDDTHSVQLIDLGDEDGSDLGDTIADAPTLRAAIDAARAATREEGTPR